MKILSPSTRVISLLGNFLLFSFVISLLGPGRSWSNEKNTEKASEKLYVTASYISWQEALQLLSPTGTAYDLRSTSRGVCLGADVRYPLRDGNEFDYSLCYLFGSSDVGAPTGSLASPAPYSAQGATVRGLNGEVGYAFKPGGDSVSIGPRLGLMYRSVNWDSVSPQPASGYSVSDHAFHASLTVQTKFDLGPVYIAPSVGFYSQASNFVWLLGVGFKLF